MDHNHTLGKTFNMQKQRWNTSMSKMNIFYYLYIWLWYSFVFNELNLSYSWVVSKEKSVFKKMSIDFALSFIKRSIK